MRALFFLALAVLVVVMLLPRLAAWGRGQFGNRPERRDELVKDPVCQTYVVMSRALRSEVGGTIVHFCSRECQDKYRRGERHA
jgi:YHS domain-containing protein